MWVRVALGAVSFSIAVLLFPDVGNGSQSDGKRPRSASEGDAYAHTGIGDGTFSFGGRVLFYNSGLIGTVPTFNKRKESSIAGSLPDYVRAAGEEERRFGWRGGFDFSGEMSLEYSGAGGRAYGVDFMVLAPELNGAVERGKPVVNRGSRVYMQSPYGQLSVGFQEGVESSMAYRGEFDDFLRGREPTLMKYRLPLLKGSYFDSGISQWFLSNAALLYPGLYSESNFRSNNYLDYYGIESESKYYSKYFVNNLPFRVSYQTPRVAGLQLGISYSPTGYAADLFRGWLDGEEAKAVYGDFSYESLVKSLEKAKVKGEDKVKGEKRVWRRDLESAYSRPMLAVRQWGYPKVSTRVVGEQVVYAPSYRSIFSAALALRRVYGGATSKGLQLDFVVSGECAKAAVSHEGKMPHGGFHNLGAVEVSALVQGGGLSFAASYGYLGLSGYPRGPWEGTALSWSRVESANVLRPTAYMVLGAGYSLGALRVEGSYFRSEKGGYLTRARLSDLGVRASYELYRGSEMRCELFAQVNRVSARYDFADGFVKQQRASAVISRSDAVVPLKYDFGSLAVGAKLLF